MRDGFCGVCKASELVGLTLASNADKTQNMLRNPGMAHQNNKESDNKG